MTVVAWAPAASTADTQGPPVAFTLKDGHVRYGEAFVASGELSRDDAGRTVVLVQLFAGGGTPRSIPRASPRTGRSGSRAGPCAPARWSSGSRATAWSPPTATGSARPAAEGKVVYVAARLERPRAGSTSSPAAAPWCAGPCARRSAAAASCSRPASAGTSARSRAPHRRARPLRPARPAPQDREHARSRALPRRRRQHERHPAARPPRRVPRGGRVLVRTRPLRRAIWAAAAASAPASWASPTRRCPAARC